MTLRSLFPSVRVLLGMPGGGVLGGLRPTNTGLTEWEHDDATKLWTLHSFNETPHLVATVARSSGAVRPRGG